MRKIVEKSMLGNAWTVLNDNEDGKITTDAQDLITKILKSRGIEGDDKIEKFLHPSIKEYMPDPFVLLDMEKATGIIADSICNGEKIAIYGDYDVDGITSTAIFVKYLKEIGVDVSWHLPTREGEGYGLNIAAIEQIVESGVKLLVTVDCGISGINEVKFAKEHGLKVVVTDHHLPDASLPEADAVINPKRNDDTSGLTYLAGVGVAFLTLVSLNRELRKRSFLKEDINLINYVDLVALGTICDTMPLVELNRAFVTSGLKVLGLQQNLGLKILMKLAEVKQQPTTYVVGFVIGPRLNAAGRLESAEPALELLLTDKHLVADDLAHKLHDLNKERILIQKRVMDAAEIEAKKSIEQGKKSLFVCGDDWHGGVMGIIAGRLKDEFNRPTCVATRKDGVINGSGRSVENVDLGKIIHEALANGILSEGGGHAAAAGFTLNADKEQEFIEFFEKSVNEQLNGDLPQHEIVVDMEMDARGVTRAFIEKLTEMAPFGQGNQEPTFVLYGGMLSDATNMGKEGKHLRGTIQTSAGSLSFVGFNLVGTSVGDFLLDRININTKIKVLGKLKENEYNGRKEPQLVLEDIAL